MEKFLRVLLLVMALNSVPADAGVAVVDGDAAGLIYDSLMVSERHTSSETYKSVGGLSCTAICVADQPCQDTCRLKYPNLGHADLWNALRAPIQEGKNTFGGNEFYKEVGALLCTAKLKGGEAKFNCVFRSR